MRVNRLPSPFGVEVHGVDLSGGVDDNSLRQLTQTLYDNRVMVIRNQQLNEDQYLRFGRAWGTPIPHVLDHMRMPGHPELMTVGNTEKRDEDAKIRNGAALWHTDQSYEQVPASATMLYSIKAPAIGGETQFCNMVDAYEELDDELKAKIGGLELAHKYGRGKRRGNEPPANPIINDDQDRRVPPIYHPLVNPHPITGVKALYALGHGAHGINGMDDERSEALIEDLKDHVLQERYIYRHKYEVGDVVVWDTMHTMHCGVPINVATSEENSRLLWRCSVRHKPRVYRDVD